MCNILKCVSEICCKNNTKDNPYFSMSIDSTIEQFARTRKDCDCSRMCDNVRMEYLRFASAIFYNVNREILNIM